MQNLHLRLIMDYKLQYESLLQENAILRKCLDQKQEEMLAIEAQLLECRVNHQQQPQGDMQPHDDDNRLVYLYKLIKKDCYNSHNCEKYQYLFVRWRTSRATVAHQFLRHRYPYMKILLEIGHSVKEINFATEVHRVLGQSKNIKVCYNAIHCSECDESCLIYTVLSLRSSLL